MYSSENRILSFLAVCAIVAAGCVSDPLLMPHEGTDDLVAADTAFADGRYHLARMRYAMAIQRYPGNETARYGLGMSHYRLGMDDNAEKQLRRYIEDFPEGRYSQDALHYLAEIEGRREALRTERVQRQQKSQERVIRAQDAVSQSPEDGLLRVKLGNTQWDIGEYQIAADQFVKAVELDNRLRRHPDVRERIDFGKNGSYVILTPGECERREIEANPVVIENTRGYRAGPGSFDFQYRWYIVSGQVLNRSSRMVTNVSVDATIFNLAGHVLDSRQMYIGTVPPGATRSFSARLTHFDDINNVYRYECKVFHN